MRFVLASVSPQRSALLAEAGYEFEVIPADVPEIASGPEPAHIALVNAEAKARETFARIKHDGVVLGADTVVDVEGVALGQPEDRAAARKHLELLSGQQHEVHTAVCVATPEGERSGVASTRLRFKELSEAEVDAYLDGGEWQGRAGGYAIQETGDAFVISVEGDFDNVVGLPLRLVRELLPDSVQPV